VLEQRGALPRVHGSHQRFVLIRLEARSGDEAHRLVEHGAVLGAPPAEGETISATAVGDLTLHGVTNSVELPIEGSLVDGGTIVVVGSMPVTMADYDIEPPTGLRVLSIEDVGTIEPQLAFVRG
jgi:hypothetical protein